MLPTFDYEDYSFRARAALKQEFPTETVATERGYNGRVRVKVVSEKLNGLTEQEKQDVVWSVLRKAFPEDELQSIAIVLAFGTDELA
jgi:stress-induced morphogen